MRLVVGRRGGVSKMSYESRKAIGSDWLTKDNLKEKDTYMFNG